MNEIVREYMRKVLMERPKLMKAVALVEGADDELTSLIVKVQGDATDDVLDAVGDVLASLRGHVCFTTGGKVGS